MDPLRHSQHEQHASTDEPVPGLRIFGVFTSTGRLKESKQPRMTQSRADDLVLHEKPVAADLQPFLLFHVDTAQIVCFSVRFRSFSRRRCLSRAKQALNIPQAARATAPNCILVLRVRQLDNAACGAI